MTNKTLKFEDFEVEKLTKKQQKAVRGGDVVDPTKGGTISNGGGGNP